MNPKKLIFKGNLLAIEQEEFVFGDKTKIFERAIRAPGIRLIVERDGKLLLTKEYRFELETFDIRLAGGKVVDTLEGYLAIRGKQDELDSALENAVKREAREELGMAVKNFELFKVSKLGATVEWDLYYYIVKDFEMLDSQELELGENIKMEWIAKSEIEKLVKSGAIDEERSAVALLRYLQS